MTTKSTDDDTSMDESLARLKENMQKVDALRERLTQVLTQSTPHHAALDGPHHALFQKAGIAYLSAAMTNPAKLFEHQVEYWNKSVSHFIEAQKAFGQDDTTTSQEDPPADRRFSNPLWQTHPYFNFIKRQYQINAQVLERAVDDIVDMVPTEKQRLQYFARQIIDMMSPTNFLATNPDALQRAIDTEGESLIRGLENLISDLEANNGEAIVRLADESAFALGENIANTPGKVVFRNNLIELIQYAPTTEKVYATPIVVFPPWINKFYVLDLKEQNSLVKWIVDQGYTLFMVSWVNPDTQHRDVGIENYIEEGYLAAIEQVKQLSRQNQINVVGYCIAGTTLSLVLALLRKRGDKSVKSATFFTALTDFADQGEFKPFLTDDFIEGIEAEAADKGYLPASIMARTFSFLRANDLIYAPAIKSYMMGETPPAFDLLYWNGDGANLPEKMAVQYLRRLCQGNELALGGMNLIGERLSLSDVDVPLCAIACETDHIAPWKDCFRGVQQMGSKDRTFILTESGHIAGIVNPPSKKKYGHYTHADLSLDYSDWHAAASFQKGSWWPLWESWLRKRSGKKVVARKPEMDLEDAPGRYVRIKSRGGIISLS